MGEICLSVVLDLEFEEEYFEFSKDSIVSHINQSLRFLFGEVGEGIPYRVECTDTEARKFNIFFDRSVSAKFRCALTLVGKYRNIPCCFRTVNIQPVTV